MDHDKRKEPTFGISGTNSLETRAPDSNMGGLVADNLENLATQLCPRATLNTSPAWPKTSLQPNCKVAFSYHSKHPYMSVI